jgi:thiamine pyrophosphokinase
MKCLIISGGNIDRDSLFEELEKTDDIYVIAVDRGVLFAADNNIPIHKAIGDFDSVSAEERARILKDYDVEVLIPEKDDTDTEHALSYAINMMPEKIIMFGCTGTRLDQTFASVRMLKCACEKGVPAYIKDKTNRIRIVKGKTVISREKAFGKYISILPYGERAEGITLKGFKYSIEDYTMTADNSLGVSNEIISDEAVIICDDYLIILETID